jgi:hypothetical protein
VVPASKIEEAVYEFPPNGEAFYIVTRMDGKRRVVTASPSNN